MAILGGAMVDGERKDQTVADKEAMEQRERLRFPVQAELTI